jgi:hypothetical protein
MPFEFKSFGRVVAVASDVEELGKVLDELSRLDPGCVEYHLLEGHISSWLKSIGEDGLAQSLRSSSSAPDAARMVRGSLTARRRQDERPSRIDVTVCRNIQFNE